MKRSTRTMIIAGFGLWALYFTGLSFQATSTPGLIQLVKLKRVLDTKTQDLSELEAKVAALKTEKSLLEQDPHYQESEIRRILGYVREDELVFDF